MAPGDAVQSGCSSAMEDLSVTCSDPHRSHKPGTRSKAAGSSLQTRTLEADIICHEDSASAKSQFLKTLIDAAAAADSAAVQLTSFTDGMDDEFANLRQSSMTNRQMMRQRGRLLGKLEDFKRINKSARQKLKQLQEAEADQTDAKQQIANLQKKVTQAESGNEHLKRDLNEAEGKLEELMDLWREEQENIKTTVQMTTSVEATRAHLQGQLCNKEAENNRLTAQLQALERTLTEQKMEVDALKSSITSLTQKAAQDREALKKAKRAHKLRAERFEAAIEKCYDQLQEKDAQLVKACLERDSRRQKKEQTTDEKEKLVAHIELLKSQITDLTARLQRERDELTAAHATVMQRVEKLSNENRDLLVNNASLKAAVARVEQQLADYESALIEEKVVSQERKHQAERCHCQVAELQAEIDEMRIKHANVLTEKEKTSDERTTEVEKVRQQLQPRVDELKPYAELLSAAGQSLHECRENLQRSERKCSEKSESIRQLQVKVESNTKLLRSTAEMKESIHEANLQLQEKVNSAQRQVDKLQQENLELVRRLAAQEEALSSSNRQLQQRSSEAQALSRQLNAALSDVKQQVKKVKDQALSREEGFQKKILELEAEKARKDNELRLLRQSKLTAEKRFDVRLKDLQLSLAQSESHKQSIQNYVDFLKSCYVTMFDDGLQTSTFGSSHFPK